MKIRPVGAAELLHADGQTTKIIVASRYFEFP